MFHGFTYPDEGGNGRLIARFWNPVMKRGVIDFIPPSECTFIRDIKNYSLKRFTIGDNLQSVQELAEEI